MELHNKLINKDNWEIPNSWKVNNTFLNRWIKDVSREIEKYFTPHEDKNIPLNLWDAVKTFL